MRPASPYALFLSSLAALSGTMLSPAACTSSSPGEDAGPATAGTSGSGVPLGGSHSAGSPSGGATSAGRATAGELGAGGAVVLTGGSASGGSNAAGDIEGVTLIKVTTLQAQGPGSLGAALAATGRRVIVFEVGGVIDLNRMRLNVTQPFVRIAGQTAPPPGITLVRGGMRVSTNDVRIEHIRFRMGDAGSEPGSGFEPDVATDGANAYNIVFDHVSVAWGVDENLSVSGPRMNGSDGTSRSVTIQNSIIAEGLKHSVHEKGAHSMGTLVHDYCTDVLVARNLYAHNDERNPWYKGYATGAIVNNVIYNPGRWAIRLGPVDSEWTSAGIRPEGPRVSIVGNYLKHGRDTQDGLPMIGTNSRGSAYIEDNIAVTGTGEAAPVAADAITELTEKPAWRDGLVALPASSVLESVLAHAGARPKERDAIDERIIAAVVAGVGTIIDSQDEVGGYPMPSATQRALDLPTANLEAWLATYSAQVE